MKKRMLIVVLALVGLFLWMCNSSCKETMPLPKRVIVECFPYSIYPPYVFYGNLHVIDDEVIGVSIYVPRYYYGYRPHPYQPYYYHHQYVPTGPKYYGRPHR
jgi:hypothetical protein